ncbi:uncharacterized protein LOC129777567 [Toxorhynchites rutilus septentrionalis]|uniref:uncharacterized protein LOC129777567 n=1 Tax=Toxorhynchites rutilus septentrionalis TaxID=329112 RepID=UPI00247AE2A3|nr:uncharacterized protein LOC129777567 [Toxorhynchites rutilus septentrionalis]
MQRMSDCTTTTVPQFFPNRMVRTYKRKRDHYWSDTSLENVMNIEEGLSVPGASKQFGVPEPTLRRYRRKYPDMEDTSSNKDRFKATFRSSFEVLSIRLRLNMA